MIDESKKAGGFARAESLTPNERSAIARRAALARHRKDMPKAVAEGVLKIGDLRLPCAVLDDANNTRVLTQNGFLKAIGRHPFASGGSGSAIDETAPFLRAKNLKPFISEELERSSAPLLYLPRNPTAGDAGIGYGYRGTLLPGVCWVYQDALVAGKLLSNQAHIGVAAREFLKALTNYAIDDLIDQATGFDDIRKRDAILRILEKYITQDKLPWVKMFDNEFYRQVFRLNNWTFDPEKTARPSVIGHWTNNIYDRLAPGIRPTLQAKVRRNADGKPTQKMTQYLTDEAGKVRLKEMLEGVKTVMKLSSDKQDFWQKMDVAYPKFDDSFTLPFADLPRLEKPKK